MTPFRVKTAFLTARPVLFVPRLEHFETACLVSLDMLQLGSCTTLLRSVFLRAAESLFHFTPGRPYSLR